MQIILFLLLQIELCLNVFFYQSYPSAADTDLTFEEAVVKQGDLKLGVISQVMDFTMNAYCSDKISRFDWIQNIQAVVHTIEQINSRVDILPNVTLGYVLLPDCGRRDTALANAVRLLPISCEAGKAHISGTKQIIYDVVGVVGLTTSTKAIPLASLFSYFHIPQISTTATSDVLENKQLFSYFFRMVPPNEYQTQAIADFIKHFGWNYISIISSRSSALCYGIDLFRYYIKERGICEAFSSVVGLETTEKDYDMIISSLRQFKNARVVVLLTFSKYARKVFQALRRANAAGEFIFIGSETVDVRAYGGFEELVHGLFQVTFPQDFDERLHQYILQQTPFNGTENLLPWYKRLWESKFSCAWESHIHHKDSCRVFRNISEAKGFYFSEWNAKYIDATYAFAYALHNLIKTKCPGAFQQKVKLKSCVDGRTLLKYLRNVRFDGISGHIKFDKAGNALSDLIFKHLKRDRHNVYYATTIARWFNSRKALGPIDISRIQWNLHEMYTNATPIPISVCSLPCPAGHMQITKHPACCWQCRACDSNEYVNSNGSMCLKCPALTWPDQTNFTSCEKIEPLYLSASDPPAIALIIVACFGVGTTLVFLFHFVKFRESQAIKNSGRELCGIIFLGVLMSFVTSISLITRPNYFSCNFSRFGFDMSPCLIYTPLFLKTIRAHRLFAAANKFQVKVSCADSRSQIMAVASICSLQVALTLITSSVLKPHPVLKMPMPIERYVELTCDWPLSGLLVPLSANLLLVALCSIFGFTTRKLPENFKESRYIFLSVMTTLIIWVVFLPTYFLTFYSYHRLALLALGLTLNAYVTLLCIFAPKLYVVHYVEVEEDSRDSRMLNANGFLCQRASSFKHGENPR